MKALLFLPLCLLLCSCDALPQAREMGDMALLRALAVDGEPGAYVLTASTGQRTKGLQGETQSALVLEGGGTSLTLARQQLEEQGESRVFSGYVDHLLLGETLTEGGAEAFLAHLARDRELGLGAWLWVAGDGGAAALKSGGERGIEPRLTALARRAGEDFPLIPRRAEEVYADLLDLGACYVPLLELRQESLFPAGYAVFKGEKLAGVLEGEDARGLELLAGRAEGQLLPVTLEGQSLVLEVTNSTLTCRREGGGMALTCRVEAGLAEYVRKPSPEQERELERLLEQVCTARMEGTLRQFTLWQTDCLGLSAKAALTDPLSWLGREQPGLAGARVIVIGAVRP